MIIRFYLRRHVNYIGLTETKLPFKIAYDSEMCCKHRGHVLLQERELYYVSKYAYECSKT